MPNIYANTIIRLATEQKVSASNSTKHNKDSRKRLDKIAQRQALFALLTLANQNKDISKRD